MPSRTRHSILLIAPLFAASWLFAAGPVIENDQVRVFRVKLAPHGTLAMHEHVVNKIVVNLMPMHERVTTATGQEDVVDHAETTAAWGGPVKHREQNLAATAMDSLVIELKN